MSEDMNVAVALEEQSIAQLRALAAQHYQIAVMKDMTKQQLIDAIKNKQNNSVQKYARVGSGDIPPGYARIRIERQNEAMDGSSGSRPVLAGINGYQILIPRNVAVDVPIKFYNHLMSLTRSVLEVNEREPLDSPERQTWQEVSRFPVTLLGMNDIGIDVKITPWERQREAKLALPREFCEKYEYWPSAADLREYRKSKFNAAAVA